MSVSVHPTCVVGPGAELGEGTEVGPYAVIESGVVVGQRCRIASHAIIREFTRMASDNQVFEHAVIGGTPQDFGYSGARSSVRIGSGNLFREGVTVHRATTPDGETVIGDSNYLMANAHVAHDCVLGDNIVLANNVALAGHVTIEDRAFVSGGVVVHQFVQLGTHSMIGGNSKITQDVLPYALVDGVPARVRGLNLVGLRRNGFSSGDISDLKQAFRVLFDSGGPLARRLSDMEGIASPHVTHLITFIRNSKRSFHTRKGDTRD
jgi:UDP-N-acetylglucosamine acyltransferase